MIHYSILPIAEDEETFQYEYMEYSGLDVVACQTPEGYVLERIFSTDPRDFLREDLKPGCLLENSLIKKNIK